MHPTSLTCYIAYSISIESDIRNVINVRIRMHVYDLFIMYVRNYVCMYVCMYVSTSTLRIILILYI